ncbi:Kinesin light chain 5 [Colletotrichum musicola]|uniref:Kinesin light chain 5 n=1 Tax=Colletotrichum musicola TaxID=2175873 RepID=A0A8H6NTC7_9PEZI|nr:Kinesin light chain 5 [Colletotrichum musicola]
MSDLQSYTVGWICAIPTELAAARTFLDEQHPTPEAVARNDNNSYALGTMGKHNVVIAILPKREYGISAAATVARDLVHSFPNIRIGLMVGVGGGAPTKQHDIRLGDVVIGSRDSGKGGVIQYDYGKMIQNQAFVETGSLNQPPPALLNAVAGLETDYMMQGPDLISKVEKALAPWKRLQKTHSRPHPSTDRLCKPDFTHPLDSSAPCSQTCHANTANMVSRDERGEHEDNPTIHYGLIASANQIIKNAKIRDTLSAEKGVICFEMEAAGLMNHFPCLVIRGICDYSDSHKNKEWQGFAAMTAAAYAKDLLRKIPPNIVEAEKPIREVLGSIHEDVQRLNQTTDETRTGVRTIQSHQTEQTHRLIHIQRGVQDLKLSKLEDPSIARNPHFVVPFPSDPDFVNRSDIWTWIEERYAGPESRFALVGMGGFGVFWVHGSTKETFEESYRSIADVLALPRRHDPDVDVLVLVRDWLQREDVSPWLMVIDNADDIQMLFSKRNSEKPITSYLPKRENSKILITSRNSDVAERLTGNIKMNYTVPTMENEQALQLLQKKLGWDVNEAAASRLSRTLDCIPLAVNQAAAYINKRITWQVTFEQIKREQPRAANLLSLMSYFHAQNIPEYMLHDYDSGDIHSKEGSDEDGGTSDIDFEDDLDVLRGYSLVTITATPGLLEMHSLVQFSSEHFPSGVFETWQQCQTLMPHIQPLLDKQPSEERNQLEWSKLLTNVSWYLVMLGNYSRAEVIVRQAVTIRTEILGQEHPSTLTSMANLASTYWNQGRWKEAEELEVRVMETRKTVLGEDHPSTLTSMANLASTYTDQGRWKEAEELEVRVMETSLRVLGEEHPSTLTSMANLASTYRNQGRWKEAEELQAKELEICARVLGEEHPDTLTSMANLASTFWNQGRLKEVEELEVRVMETRKTVLGEEHPDTLTSMANLASTYRNQGRWKEAEELQAKELEICARVLGEEHPDTLTSMHNLAFTWKDLERWEEAIQLLQGCIRHRENLLGEDHPDTISSASALSDWKLEFRGIS